METGTSHPSFLHMVRLTVAVWVRWWEVKLKRCGRWWFLKLGGRR